MRYLKAFLLLLVTGGSTVLLSACYGYMAPVDSDGNLTKSPVLTNNLDIIVRNVQNSNRIAGILCSVSSNAVELDSCLTSTNGEAMLSYETNGTFSYDLIITDIDGALNGGDFSTKTNSNPVSGDYYLTPKP